MAEKKSSKSWEISDELWEAVKDKAPIPPQGNTCTLKSAIQQCTVSRKLRLGQR